MDESAQTRTLSNARARRELIARARQDLVAREAELVVEALTCTDPESRRQLAARLRNLIGFRREIVKRSRRYTPDRAARDAAGLEILDQAREWLDASVTVRE